MGQEHQTQEQLNPPGCQELENFSIFVYPILRFLSYTGTIDYNHPFQYGIPGFTHSFHFDPLSQPEG